MRASARIVSPFERYRANKWPALLRLVRREPDSPNHAGRLMKTDPLFRNTIIVTGILFSAALVWCAYPTDPDVDAALARCTCAAHARR